MHVIYYVEDDLNVRNLAVYALEQAGLKVVGFGSWSELQAALKDALPSLILLDIMLPDEDGIAILKRLRADAATAAIPVMMLTAKGTEFDVVVGLDSGADDYLTKPFGMMELVSRVNALLRREGRAAAPSAAAGAQAASAGAAVGGAAGGTAAAGVAGAGGATGGAAAAAGASAGALQPAAATAAAPAAPAAADVPLTLEGIELWERKHQVKVSGKRVELTLREFELLSFLMQNPGLVFTRDHLLQSIWGWGFEGTTRTVDVHIQTLRQKLGREAAAAIVTVRGVGYKIREASEIEGDQ